MRVWKFSEFKCHGLKLLFLHRVWESGGVGGSANSGLRSPESSLCPNVIYIFILKFRNDFMFNNSSAKMQIYVAIYNNACEAV